MADSNNPIVVETTKEFRVPVEKVFDAWNSGEKLKQWWHPFNKNLSRVVNELKPGGAVEYEFEGDQKFHISGEYQEVVENRRLVYSWIWDLEHDEMKNGDYKLTIDFIPGEGGSELRVKQEGFDDEKATDIHKLGWDRGLEVLRSYLEDNSGGVQSDAEGQQQESKSNKQQSQSGSEGEQPAAKAENQQPEAKAEGQEPQSKAEGEPEVKDESPSTGKGPKPVGPGQQTWENPKPGEELKKEIDDQLDKLKKLGENPSDHNPETDKLNQAQDIESRNEGPEHSKKSENNTQEDFDPSKHKTDAPTH